MEPGGDDPRLSVGQSDDHRGAIGPISTGSGG